MQNIVGDPYAIGYISLGSLNDTVAAMQIDGVDATTENVKNKSYGISRPFIIATKSEPTEATQDFIRYILSIEGQAAVGDSYIPIDDNAPAYASNHASGKIIIAGSFSVTSVMEKLMESYLALNPKVTIEL